MFFHIISPLYTLGCRVLVLCNHSSLFDAYTNLNSNVNIILHPNQYALVSDLNTVTNFISFANVNTSNTPYTQGISGNTSEFFVLTAKPYTLAYNVQYAFTNTPDNTTYSIFKRGYPSSKVWDNWKKVI